MINLLPDSLAENSQSSMFSRKWSVLQSSVIVLLLINTASTLGKLFLQTYTVYIVEQSFY